ncbi:MAG: N-acyl homoserine lactonase family protein [Pseudomonadota bacterium]
MPRLLWALTSRSWVDLPINVFLIEHEDGLVLFDTGLDPALKTNPNYISQAIGRFLVDRIFRFDIAPDDKLGKKLENIGFAAEDIRKAVISHLHFDHVGGIADIPQAELLVSEREWAQLSDPHPEHEWILREHIEIPSANWRPVQFQSTDDPLFEPFGGCYDVMGDGSMVLLPTPGHTPGSMSMLVRSLGLPPILLIGDLAYEPALIFQDQVPGTGDAKTLRESYARVRALKKNLPDLVIMASHDPEASDALSQAMAAPNA